LEERPATMGQKGRGRLGGKKKWGGKFKNEGRGEDRRFKTVKKAQNWGGGGA